MTALAILRIITGLNVVIRESSSTLRMLRKNVQDSETLADADKETLLSEIDAGNQLVESLEYPEDETA